MKWHLRLLSLCVLAFLAATLGVDAKPTKKDGKKDDAKTESASSNYYPLNVGNTWNYRVEVGGNSAQAISKIAKVETIDGLQLYRLEATVNNNIVATEHLRVTQDGVYRHRNNGQEINPPLRLLKYPAKSGDKWEGDIVVGKEKGKYSCTSNEENVEVSAGKFKAMRVTITLESKMQKVTTSYWFVQNIGFVKQTVEAGDLNITMELEKFDLRQTDPEKK